MNGLDLEGVLRDHSFSLSTRSCVCGVGPRRGQIWFDHRAHVAAVLREQVVAAQAEARRQVVEGLMGAMPERSFDSRYRDGFAAAIMAANAMLSSRAALLAPARVPSEEG